MLSNEVNTSLDKRDSEIFFGDNNGQDRIGYSHCCRKQFSSPPEGKKKQS